MKNKKSKDSTIPKNLPLKTFTIVSYSTTVKGLIDIEDDIRVDGSVEGDIHCKGKIVIGAEGHIVGNIKSKSIEICGKLYGDIIASDSVILRASSYYKGVMATGSVEIEAGAQFFGSCRMEENEKGMAKNNGKSQSATTDGKTKEVA